MDTQHFFGGGGQTDVSLLTLLLVVAASISLLTVPRRYLVVPMIVATVLIPLDQQVVLGGIHLMMARILIVVGWARVAQLKSQDSPYAKAAWTPIDTVFLLYCISNTVMYVVLWSGDTGALINRGGFIFNACGTYFFMRYLITTLEDLERVMKVLAGVFVIVAAGMLVEQFTGQNVFSVLGSIPLRSVTRDGAIRAQGTFVHPLTAGAIGATLLPVCFGVWWINRKNKGLAILGVIASFVIGIASRSSTALLVLAAGVVGMSMWPWRQHMRVLRWSVLAILVCLHMVMKAPVWALIARIDLTGSSSGYHRYILVDQFIRRFSEWCLVGTRTTAGWGWDMWDTINSYVAAGTSGGLVNFVLFVAVFVIAFQQLGRSRLTASNEPQLERMLWVLSTLLFVHAVAFFGIDYFDQSQFVWYAELAMIAAATTLGLSSTVVSRPQRPVADEVVWDFGQGGRLTISD
jgi:uncharacterized membrane protein YwzB